MADFLTHILVADQVLKRIESRRVSESIIKNQSLYYLGAQGPDPLFYYNCFPSILKGNMYNLGRRMHRQSTGAFLEYGFSKLQDISYDRHWALLAVYLCGFICHFNLDRMLHPYVYWVVRHWIWGVDGTPKKVSHQQVEMNLDVLYWQEVKGVPAYKTRTRKLIDIGSKWPDSIALFLMEAFSKFYGINKSEKEINKILKDFYRGNDLLFDPVGWKKALINWLENLTGGGIKSPKYPYSMEYDKTIDWANRKKRTWFNPFTEGETSNASVDEILEDAVHTAGQHINIIFSKIFERKSIQGLFPDYSYITGNLCD
jgi:hypothetical protein